MAYLAFYKGKGTWVDRLIRWSTRSAYSHVEIVHDMEEKWQHFTFGYQCYSSSARDGGVRSKLIKLNPDHWDLVEVTWRDDFDLDLFIENDSAKYDYSGIVFSHIFSLGRHNKNKWFCSEICAAALGLPKPQNYSPGRLKDHVTQLNHIYKQGLKAA